MAWGTQVAHQRPRHLTRTHDVPVHATFHLNEFYCCLKNSYVDCHNFKTELSLLLLISAVKHAFFLLRLENAFAYSFR